MSNWRRSAAFIVMTTSVFLASSALAQGESEFLLGIGYTRMNFDGDNVLIDNRDGIHLDPVFSLAPIDPLPQLRFGAAVGISFAVDDVRGAVVSDNDGRSLFVEGDKVSLMLFEPELRVSWRQSFGEDHAYFLEAGVGGGGVIGWLSTGDGEGDDSGAADAELNETDGAFMGRLFVRFGMRVTGGLAGIEASYMQGGNLDFSEGISGDVSEAYVGIFGALVF